MASSFDVTANVKLNSANLNANAKKIELALGRITGQASEFQKSLDASTARVFAFGATTAVLNSVNQAFRKLISTTIEVEKKLIEINSIFQATEKTFNKFRNSIFRVAKETGQGFNTVAEGAAELARQGLSAEETAKRLKASLVLTRISGLGAEKSVKALTAAINGFASAGLSAEQIVNKLVAVDTAFAVSAQDLAEAFSRAGSTAEDAGVSFNQLLGLVTAVEQKTARGGAVIGNAFKSIFTRLSRGDTIESLKELGVQIDATQNGIQKLSALSNALEGISDPTVASQIKELAGGVFQINVVSAALKDLSSETSIFQNAATVAANASNEAFEKNAELNKSIAAQINVLVQGLTSLAERIGSITFGPLLENLVGLTSKFTEFLDKALDPEKGNTFIKGLFKAIGSFLSGPAVVVFTAAFIKIFALVAKFAKDGLKSVFAIGSESTKIKNVEAGIVGLLQKDKQLRSIIASTTATQAQKETAIINAIRTENALLTQQSILMNSIASAARARGVSSFSGSTGKFKGKGFASGFQQEEAMAKGLGASGGVKAHFGGGTIGGRKFIMNSQEMEIPNFAGGRDSAVIPMYAGGSAAGASRRRKGTKRTSSKGTLMLDGSSFGLLSAKSGAVPAVSTTGINTLSGISKSGISAMGIPVKDVKQVQLSGLNVSSLDKGNSNFEKQYQSQVTKSFAGPLVNFGSKMVGETYSNNDKRAITSNLKKQKSTQLFSSSVQGGIFESAMRMVMAGTRAAKAFRGGNERAPFDFEEKGNAKRPFVSRFFGKKKIARADAKLTANKDAARSFIHKILQDEKARAFARPKLMAGGHIPKYAKGMMGKIGKNLGSGAGFGALFGIQTLIETFGVGTKEVKNELGEVTTELTGFGKTLRGVTIGLASLSTLAGLGIGGGLLKAGKGVMGSFKGVDKGVGRMGKSNLLSMRPTGAVMGSLSAQRGMPIGKGSTAFRAASRGVDPRDPKNLKFIQKGTNKADRAAREAFLRKQAGRNAAKTAMGTGGTGAAVKGGARAFARVLGPIGAIIGALELGNFIGGTAGRAIGGGITDRNRRTSGLEGNLAGAGLSDMLAVDSIMRETEGVNLLHESNPVLIQAQSDFAKALNKARAKTENGTIALNDRIKIEEDFQNAIKGEILAIKASKIKSKIRDEQSNIRRIARGPSSLDIRGGASRSANMANRASLMGRLTLPDGPKSMQVGAARAAAASGSNAANALMQKRLLETELRGETDPEKRADLAKKIVDAGKTFQKAVEDGSIDFQNRLASLTKQLSEAEKSRMNLVRERRKDALGNLRAGGDNVSAEKLLSQFQAQLRKDAKNARHAERNIGSVGQKVVNKRRDNMLETIQRFMDNPTLQNFAKDQNVTMSGLGSQNSVAALAGTGYDFVTLQRERRNRGLGANTIGDMNDLRSEEGGNIDSQIKKAEASISNISETIENTETALDNFSKLFDTDEARGISANINKMAKGLDDAAKGLIGVPDATSALNTAATNTVKLAETATKMFENTDKALDQARIRLNALNERLFKVEQGLEGN
jgi:TP901 family phage tail tape measure protein